MIYLVISGILLAIASGIFAWGIVQKKKRQQDQQAPAPQNGNTWTSEDEATARRQREELDRVNEELDAKKTQLNDLNNACISAESALNQTMAMQTQHAEQLKHFDEVLFDTKLARLGEYMRDAAEALQLLQEQNREDWDAFVADLQKQGEAIKREIDDFYRKREMINEAILREREIAEKTDFYRICLEQSDKEDIALLSSIRTRISKPLIVDKAIYDNYIAKYVKEMEKRVLAGRNPCGIYKVTNIQTQEIYIGKSTTIADRWISHVKAAAGLDGVADSIFQRALKKYGVDQFTWELIEEVPKDKLTEREKFYISLYDTTKVGYNMRLG